ncbi:isopeptide-forming domain-containing fimbrial protein [Bifidobacterium moukalabense]|uniref:isopeptide-forming domain-containing fimbrial protein n=1 Tax=Bifidobacterium moukalabense TaxID=1333651 RepID=UPI0010F92D1E|nr:isopeptide-forming domain-containing fimbrial protein [Bifidobacterium moukalabense]
MNAKKLFAGVVAAATLLGGMALGAASAQANPTDAATITVTNAAAGSEFKAYKFAEFADPEGTAPTMTKVQVNTVAEAKTAVENAAKSASGVSEIPDPYKDNPAAYVATFTDAQLRAFADAMDVSGLSVADAQTAATEAATVTLSVTEGWYLVTDSNGVPTVVATRVTANGATYTTFNRKSGAALTLGTVVAKSNTPPTPTKTAEEKAKAMGVGSVANYTIQAKLPNLLGKTNPMFKIMDKPGVGLTVNKDIKVYVEGGSSEITVDGNKVNVTEIPVSSYTVGGFTSNELKGNGTDQFTVDLTNYAVSEAGLANAGKTIYVQYTGVINEEVKESETVVNTPSVDTNSGTVVAGDEVELITGRFEFTKVGVDNEKLKDVTFNVKDSQGTTLKFVATDNGYMLSAAAAASADIKSGADGKVRVFGLPEGTYTVTETATREDLGYSKQFMADFKVKVSVDQATKKATFALDTTSGNVLKLATSDNGAITVKNVKSVTQLPLTGAAGTALFAVVALLLAGAGVTLALKSRNTMIES